MINLGTTLIASQGLACVDIADIYRHVYTLGNHRSGKTNFFVNCFDQLKEHAFIILDPSGELAYQIAGLADKDRLTWVDKEHPLTINPLKRRSLSRGDLTKDLIEIIDNCVTSTSQSVEITPMMEEVIRNAIRIFNEEDMQLDYLCDFLLNERTRVKYRGDKYWLDFDEKDKSRYGYKKWQHRDSAQRIATRISALYDYDDFKHFTIGENQFDLDNIISNKRIIIFNLQGFNSDSMLYMGNLIMCAIKGHFTRLKGFNKTPMFVMVDEFYQFMTPAYKTMLTGASKHNIGMFLCHHSHDTKGAVKVRRVADEKCDTWLRFRTTP
jgi:hypothetical protein